MSQKEIIIGRHKIGNGHPPFIIAEMSGNHNGDLDRALQIVDAAAKAGAHALKIQTYTPDTMTLDLKEGDFLIDDPESLWNGHTLYSLYDKARTPYEWHEPIFKRCNEKGLVFFSSPFDPTAVDFLEKLGVSLFKIASFENTDHILLRRVAKTGKPVILSTGMATVDELQESVDTLRTNGCRDLILLKCTSAYPAKPETANLLTIPHMKSLFKCEVGLSDHTLGLGVPLAASALGASVIEKHFTLKRGDGGVDSAFSMEPQEMADLVTQSAAARAALGSVFYGMSDAEKKSLRFKRTLYVVKDIKKGEKFSEANMRPIRPGKGLPVKYFDVFKGKPASKDVKKGTPLSLDLLG